ncbi:GTP 3',8-cyclase MoaA [Sorangium sp. So ce124]|uniref:GTP 3',8-cyclase MoaA n=1 Tax=Sorangium sp. So ce124 TaxID=3133280 RepID=UPI003F625FAD
MLATMPLPGAAGARRSEGQTSTVDVHGRPIGDLRISVTDRCNLRCSYCMPEEQYAWLPHEDILRFEEISFLVDVFAALGAAKVRLTGGEPLLRRDLRTLVRFIADKPGIHDIAMTTNGVLLAEHAHALRAAGLQRVTVSLDTLHPERFKALTRRTTHAQVLDGLRSVPAAGFADTKIDAVVIRGVNDDELADLIEFGRTIPAQVRFIEYMDVGGATQWSCDKVVSRAEILRSLSRRYGRVEAIPSEGAAPAAQFALPDGTTFGIISSTTQPFCGACNRSRLTADGMWYLCLYAPRGTNLREPLRQGASLEEMKALVARVWGARSDRGAEARLADRSRGALLPAIQLKRDAHLEMHTRGG